MRCCQLPNATATRQHTLIPASAVAVRPLICVAPSTLASPPLPGRVQGASCSAGRGQRLVCNFRESSRSVEKLTTASSFSDQKPLRDGPVLVAFNDTEDGTWALKWAATNLCYPGDPQEQLHLAHVVCDPRALGSSTSVGTVAGNQGSGARPRLVPGAENQVGKGVKEYMDRLFEKAQANIDKRCGQVLKNLPVPYQIHLPALPCPRSASVIGETLLFTADHVGARLLVVASHGPGALAEYGSVARYCYQHSTLPLVLIPPAHRRHMAAAAGAGISPEQSMQQEGAYEEEMERVISTAVPCTSSSVEAEHPPAGADASTDPGQGRQQQPSAQQQEQQERGGSSGGASKAGYREVLLVVTQLEELEQHWQWVSDNLCRRGDVLNIWHCNLMEDTASTPGPALVAGKQGLASLPTALQQVLRARGLADVKYTPHYMTSAAEAAQKVCSAAEALDGPRMVVLLNYTRQSLLQEALRGSIASELSRHCPAPLVLLQPAA